MSKKLRILHITTHDEECGIAKYQEQYLQAMRNAPNIENVVFKYSPNKTKVMQQHELESVLGEFSGQVKKFDVLHIQHEFSFYSKDELDKFVELAKKEGKKVIITVHTSLHAGIPKLNLSKAIFKGLRHIVGTNNLRRYVIDVHVNPLKKADLVLVHNKVTADSLVKYGVARNNILKLTMPVPKINFDLKTTEISAGLNKKPGDIVFCTVGFMSENKGMRDALMALMDLPDNYKLAMIGGKHPSGANDAFYGEIENLIKTHKLGKRAYITGYVKEDANLNAMIRECDICVYPFHKKYYSGVTSASLNNSLANHKAAITYPTDPIKEMNAEMPAVVMCESFNYRDLAKAIERIDITKQESIAKQYALKFSYDKQAARLVEIYGTLALR